MRILLLGEYSRLHNSLKEGLIRLGHEVILVGAGDGFKNYPVDYSIRAKWCETRLGNIPRQIIFKLLRFDFAKIEIAFRYYLLSKKLKGFDVVQLINESSIKTVLWTERLFVKKLIKNNKKLFVLSSGVDYLNVKYYLENTQEKSILKPYFDNPSLKKEYSYVLDYLTKEHKKLHDLVYENCEGIIASDVDYLLPLQDNIKFSGLIPNAINCSKLEFKDLIINDTVNIFLGINQ